MIIPNKPHMCVPSILMSFCVLKGEVFFCCFFHPCESAVKQQINYGWCNKYKIGKKKSVHICSDTLPILFFICHRFNHMGLCVLCDRYTYLLGVVLLLS